MREYKFRAWDNEANLMIYSDHRNRKLYDAYYYFETDSKGELKCNWETEWTESCQPDGGAFNNLMQYTGFKDNNEIEIYDGDIVRVTDANGEITKYNSDTGIGVVEWLEKWGFWNVSGIENALGDIIYNYEVEVIGNKWENPELLKEK